MNNIFIIKNSELAQLGEATFPKLPIGPVLAQQRVGQDQSSTINQADIGIWESTPGQFKRHITQREFSHIIKGWCIFTPENGEPIELHPGDAILFPENCQGVWDIKENFRKTYCIF